MSLLNKSPIIPLDPSPNDFVFPLGLDLSLSNSSSLHSNDYESDLEVIFQDYMHVLTSSIPITHPLNTPKTIQTPSSLVDSLLDSYVVLLISVGFKSCLFFTGYLFMTLLIF